MVIVCWDNPAQGSFVRNMAAARDMFHTTEVGVGAAGSLPLS